MFCSKCGTKINTVIKKSLFIFVFFTLCTLTLSAQEITVFEYKEQFGRINLTLNNEIVSSTKKYFFTLSYVGEDWQAYRSLTLNIDEKDYYLLFTNITQNFYGYTSDETCKTKFLDDTIITALRSANIVKFTIESVRFRREATFTFPNDALVRIKQYIK